MIFFHFFFFLASTFESKPEEPEKPIEKKKEQPQQRRNTKEKRNEQTEKKTTTVEKKQEKNERKVSVGKGTQFGKEEKPGRSSKVEKPSKSVQNPISEITNVKKNEVEKVNQPGESVCLFSSFSFFFTSYSSFALLISLFFPPFFSYSFSLFHFLSSLYLSFFPLSCSYSPIDVFFSFCLFFPF